MSGGNYDVTEVDHAVAFALLLSNRTEWREGVHRYVFTDAQIDAMVREEHGEVDAGIALGLLRAGRVRLLRVPRDGESSCYGPSLVYRDAVA